MNGFLEPKTENENRFYDNKVKEKYENKDIYRSVRPNEYSNANVNVIEIENASFGWEIPATRKEIGSRQKSKIGLCTRLRHCCCVTKRSKESKRKRSCSSRCCSIFCQCLLNRQSNYELENDNGSTRAYGKVVDTEDSLYESLLNVKETPKGNFPASKWDNSSMDAISPSEHLLEWEKDWDEVNTSKEHMRGRTNSFSSVSIPSDHTYNYSIKNLTSPPSTTNKALHVQGAVRGPITQTPVMRAILHSISIKFPKNRLTLIVGPTGCGKSTLIAGLLGECTLLSGQVRKGTGAVSGIAYVPQTAWIQNATIRDNILFGSVMEPNRYVEMLFYTYSMSSEYCNVTYNIKICCSAPSLCFIA